MLRSCPKDSDGMLGQMGRLLYIERDPELHNYQTGVTVIYTLREYRREI